MFALCLESSHKKGMGHFFRVLNFIKYLNSVDENYIIFINDDKTAISLLKRKKISFEVVEFKDFESNWESTLIKKHNINIWLNDRLETDLRHSQNVKTNNISLITFDDRGKGAELADINIVSLARKEDEILKGKKLLLGLDYLILNPDIQNYKRVRKNVNNIIVSMGGSDTYGVTLNVVKSLMNNNKKITVITGPSFKDHEILYNIKNKDNITILNSVPSLIEEFYKNDLAITGGGITPFEANASGLPSIIIANEPHEVYNANILANIGSSYFAGYYKDIDFNLFNFNLDIEKMSQIGINSIKNDAVARIYKKIKQL